MKHIDFDALSDSHFIRQAQLIAPAGPIPFSSSTLWRRLKVDFPAPVKLGKNIIAWRVGDVRKWISNQLIENK